MPTDTLSRSARLLRCNRALSYLAINSLPILRASVAPSSASLARGKGSCICSNHDLVAALGFVDKGQRGYRRGGVAMSIDNRTDVYSAAVICSLARVRPRPEGLRRAKETPPKTISRGRGSGARRKRMEQIPQQRSILIIEKRHYYVGSLKSQRGVVHCSADSVWETQKEKSGVVG